MLEDLDFLSRHSTVRIANQPHQGLHPRLELRGRTAAFPGKLRLGKKCERFHPQRAERMGGKPILLGRSLARLVIESSAIFAIRRLTFLTNGSSHSASYILRSPGQRMVAAVIVRLIIIKTLLFGAARQAAGCLPACQEIGQSRCGYGPYRAL